MRKQSSEPVKVQRRHFTKRKKPNLFHELNLPDELDGFDFIFKQTNEKVISKASQVMRKAGDYSPEFQLEYNESIHGEEFRRRAKFPPNANPKGIEMIKNLIKEY